MRVRLRIERTTVDEAELVFELPDGTDLDEVDWAASADRRVDEMREADEAVEWELQSEGYDAAPGEEPETLEEEGTA